MLARAMICIGVLLLLSGCASVTRFSSENASGYRMLEREECVPYARRVSGIPIRGDAHTWWAQAASRYQRGSRPMPGAVLVLSQSSRLRYGHLAVVQSIVSPREINVTHTNWGDDMVSRRVTYESMRAKDVSPANDWTSVRFWNMENKVFGAPYPAHGFIYNMPATNTAYQPLPISAPASAPLSAPMPVPVTAPVMPPVVKPMPAPAPRRSGMHMIPVY